MYVNVLASPRTKIVCSARFSEYIAVSNPPQPRIGTETLMKNLLLAIALGLGLAACQSSHLLPTLGVGTANGPFVDLKSTGVSVTTATPPRSEVCAAQSTKACVGCSVSCPSNRQAICKEGKDAGPANVRLPILFARRNRVVGVNSVQTCGWFFPTQRTR